MKVSLSNLYSADVMRVGPLALTPAKSRRTAKTERHVDRDLVKFHVLRRFYPKQARFEASHVPAKKGWVALMAS